MKSALLFLIFNRPETTAKVFETIRLAKPPRLYICADGPRHDRDGEEERCAEVRRIATNVDWICDVHLRFRRDNLGCKLSVSDGINWFFENEEEGVILEDDVLPSIGFFQFCDEMLVRYRENCRVGIVSGSNFSSVPIDSQASYGFSRYPFIWGWASWRRAWKHYDLDMKSWEGWRDNGGFDKFFYRSICAKMYWKTIFDKTSCGSINTWDYQWIFACWTNKLFSVVPEVNLTKNLGFGADATHTKASEPSYVIDSRVGELNFPLRHPTAFVRNQIFDSDIEYRVYDLKRWTCIKIWLSKIGAVRNVYNFFRYFHDIATKKL